MNLESFSIQMDIKCGNLNILRQVLTIACYPETLEVPIRGRLQLRILELGDEAGEKQK